ncbi:MAG: FkbM family methyltransferase [Crocosphaera sp.]|nr:FkbM family methyltransferase [Crocosphaera sp.]
MNIKDYLITKLRRVIGIIDILEGIDRLEKDQKRALSQKILNLIQPGSVVQCRINQIDLLAPIEPLKGYQHCLELGKEETLSFMIETHCANWLCSKLDYGDVVLDIGAAFGVISLPLTKVVGKKGQIHAFEPARNTQKFLKQIISLNHFNNITIVPLAISDEPGKAEFIEYTAQENFFWASDISTLSAPDTNRHHNHESYLVDVTTIDDYVASLNIEPKAIKMDIEGFELYGLQGAKTTLDRYHPYLCIDIHADVKTGKSALLEIKPFLESLGYTLTMEEHTLYGIHPQNQ